MAGDDKNLPDLVAKLRTEYDGKGIDDAKRDVREFKGELGSVGDGQPLSKADEAFAKWSERTSQAKTDTQEAAGALGEVGTAGEEAGVAAEGAFAGIASTATVATAIIGASKLALDAFNKAGAEGRLSDAQAEQYRELKDATDDLSNSLAELEANGGAAIASLVEPLADVASAFATVANAKVPFTDESWASTIFKSVEPVLQLGDALDALGIGGDSAAESEKELEERTKRVNDALRAQQAEVDATAKAMDAFAEAQMSEADAAFNLESRQQRLTDAQQKVADAEAKVNLIRSGGKTEEAIAAADRYAEAQEKLADAHRKVAEASLTLADKEDDLREAQFRQGVQSEEAIKAQRAVDQARAGVADARDAEGDAGRAVDAAKLKLDEATGAGALAKAEQDLATARRDELDSARGVAKAASDLSEAQAKANQQAFDGDDKVRAYRDSLTKLADSIGGPVGEQIRKLATDLHTANEALDIVIAKIPTVGPLFGMDFATGGAITPQTTAATPAATPTAAAARAPVAPTPATTGAAAALAGPTVAYQQTNHIRVDSTGVAHTVDDQLMWLRANGPA